MAVEDARRAVDIDCTGIIISNHGGRQLHGSRAAFDQLAEIVDAVGERIDVMRDGGVQRGTHVLKRFPWAPRRWEWGASISILWRRIVDTCQAITVSAFSSLQTAPPSSSQMKRRLPLSLAFT